MSRVLDVYLKNDLVGHLTQGGSGELSFTYDPGYLAVASNGVSISLPLQQEEFKGVPVKAFFAGLLPEESVRERLAKYLGLSESNAFALLETVGGDCAGALALYRQGEKPSEETGDVEVLDTARLKEVLNLIKRRPMLAGDDGYRLSLAGAQDKLAVRFENNMVQLVKGGRPTTHILKPVIQHIEDSAHNELFCMKLARRIGIDVPEAALCFADEEPFYLVSRYDRAVDKDGNITRVHQEDFCQVLGIVSDMKYEREGGPAIADCLNVIREHSLQPAVDQIKLLNIVIFNYLIGNADAHGKNFSLLYKGDKPELAPAYDLLSTAIYPDLAEKTAMKIGGKYKPKDIYLRHFLKLVPDTKAAHSAMTRQVQAMIRKIGDEAGNLKTELEKEGLHSAVFGQIIDVVQMRSARLKS